MAQSVTIQRGQSTCAAQFSGISSGGPGYPNGQQGGSVTLVTAPATGVSRVIMNQLSLVQTSPVPISGASGVTDVPSAAITAMVYHANNYNGDGTTRVLSPVGWGQTNSSIARLAFPPGSFNTQKTSTGTNTQAGTPFFTAGAGINTTTWPWYSPTTWGSPSVEQMTDDITTRCLTPTNVYLGPNDQLILRVATNQTGNTSYVPTYTVSWSFTLITET